MSKKSKRVKLVRPMKQLQQGPLIQPQMHEQLASRARYARQQILKGDFAGTVDTCKSLLNTLPASSALRIEALALLGLAQSMLQNYQESYDALSEAISIDPTIAELWYNLGVTCYHMGRYAESVRDYERAVELLEDDDTSEVAQKITKELVAGRQKLQAAIEEYGGPEITLEEYEHREELFTQALNLAQQGKWSEGERIFRQLTEKGSHIPSYWGNLGVSLMMQARYKEAKEALKQALAIDPDYSFARDNLKKLSEARRGKKMYPGVQVIIQTDDEKDIKQALTIYEHHSENPSITSTTVEKSGNTVTTTVNQPQGQEPVD